MGTRLELQSKLEEILGSRQVYYQTPETVKMEYPAIVYFRVKIQTGNANDRVYLKTNKYSIIVISKRPEDSLIDRILGLSYCVHERAYKFDNLYHDVFMLYF